MDYAPIVAVTLTGPQFANPAAGKKITEQTTSTRADSSLYSMGAYFFTQLFETVRIGLSITGKEKRERREDSFSPSGLGHFSPDKRISDYSPDDLLWNRPSIKDTYFRKTLTVFGHTPTDYYGMENSGRMLKTDTWIDIDTGAASGGHPMLLRLDDERPFYVKQ